jgi:hypothetical protein
MAEKRMVWVITGAMDNVRRATQYPGDYVEAEALAGYAADYPGFVVTRIEHYENKGR